jgi:hypothetical protein
MKMINKLKKGQVTIFGKTISVLAAVLALVALSGVGLALLTAYITITGSATVSQSVKLDKFESSWKYANEESDPTLPGTSAAWKTSVAVAGDEQDVGFELSNYAEVAAKVKIESTATCDETGYGAGEDVVMAIYDGYTPSDDPTCVAHLDKTSCELTPSEHCVWTESVCKGDEKCVGEAPLATQESGLDSVSTTQLLSARPSVSNPAVPSEKWYCIRHAWDIAAVPGSYGFSLVISPTEII